MTSFTSLSHTRSHTRWYIRRIRLNADGYDNDGGYWGEGPTIWYCNCPDLDLGFHIRGTRDYARYAYQWVRASSDPEAAARHIDATGKIGGWR